MTSYQLLATNNTTQGWHFALYQEFPEQQGLKSIAWKVLALSKPQPNPTTGVIPWTLTYQVTIPQKQASDSVYIGGLSQTARMGYRYEAYMDAGYIQIRELGKGTEGYIDFRNNTKAFQDMGLMVDGTLMVMQENVAGGVTSQFQVTPNYYCGLYTNLIQGQFVSSDAAVDPVQITFPSGMTTASVSADIADNQVSLSPPLYGIDVKFAAQKRQ